MRANLTEQQFLEVFLNDVPLMDVRAPIEFSEGAFPMAQNVPILDNDQRQQIGTKYAQGGQDSAIELGLTLATPAVRQQRLNAWQPFVSTNPTGYLYCFRGGLRSKTAQQWLGEAGYHYPLIEGGYKALRGFLLNQLTRLCEQGNIIVLSGMTGVGKTELIESRACAIDIESQARHRGSAFGKLFSEQPSQIDWENQITIDWLKCEAASNNPILIEAESNQIGKVYLPKVLQTALANAPRISLTAPLEERVRRLYNDYIGYQLDYFSEIKQEPWAAIEKRFADNLARIRKRLGGAQYQMLLDKLTPAITAARDDQNATPFYEIITILLRDYYDPQYQYHNKKNHLTFEFSGDVSALTRCLDDGTATGTVKGQIT